MLVQERCACLTWTQWFLGSPRYVAAGPWPLLPAHASSRHRLSCETNACVQIFLGLIALVISIVLCAQDSNYYYASATALFVSCVFTCAGILIFGSLGIFAARQSGSPQWHLQTLLVDILALICSLAAVTVSIHWVA